jgi:hypothetical protein
MNNIDDYNLSINNNIKNLILLSSKTDLNPFNKKKNKLELKSKEKLLKDYEKIKKKELKSLEQIKKKELKEIQQINKQDLKDTHYSLAHLSQLGNSNFSVFKHKIDILDKIYDCITHIDMSDDNTNNIYNHLGGSDENNAITKGKEHVETGKLLPSATLEPYHLHTKTKGNRKDCRIETLYTLSDSPNSIDHITLSKSPYLECFGNY